MIIREPAKYYLAYIFRKEGTTPPRTPLAENHFAKKRLAELGGTPLPPLTENCRKFLPRNGPQQG